MLHPLQANFKNAYLKDAMIHGEDFTPEENKITKKQVALASWIEESESDSDSDSEIYFMVLKLKGTVPFN